MASLKLCVTGSLLLMVYLCQSALADGCHRNGHDYQDGEKWDEGCEYRCECVKGETGYLVRCTGRCPKYTHLPPHCKLVKKEGECCPEQVCESGCIYNDQIYKLGEHWKNECNFDCTCVDEEARRSSCQTHCKRYHAQDLDAACHYQKKEGECCASLYCPDANGNDVKVGDKVCLFQKKFYNDGEEWQDGCEYKYSCHFNGETGTIHRRGVCPIPRLVEGCTLEDVPGECCPKIVCKGCHFNGNVYSEGEHFKNDCDFDCTCVNEDEGQVSCKTNCQRYHADDLDPACHYQKKGDECCPSLYCPDANGNDEKIGDKVCLFNKKFYNDGQNWQVGCEFKYSCNFDGQDYAVTRQDVCPTYRLQEGCALEKVAGQCCPEVVCTGCRVNGKVYTEGEHWKNECDFDCTCVDAAEGRTSCKTNCLRYAQSDLPASCHYQKKDGECCASLYCPDKEGNDQIIEKEVCLYKNEFFRDGEEWQDGCKHMCRCDYDGEKGVVKLRALCPTHHLKEGCKLEKKDGECCPQLVCVEVPKVCKYDGQSYEEGKEWTNACGFKCTCVDADAGRIKCQTNCLQYPQLPSNCAYEKEENACCADLYCTDKDGKKEKMPKEVCLYKNKFYRDDQTWQEGCEYNYTCSHDGDEQTVMQQAVCPTYGPLEDGCELVDVPGQCCPKHECTRVNGCRVGGNLYKEGDHWKNDCGFNCSCVDGATGSVHCKSTCVQYRASDMDASCSYERVDGECCPVLFCQDDNGQKVKVGKDVCLYKQKFYGDGENWQDGCQYNCTCDGKAGRVQLRSLCPTYTKLREGCSLQPVAGKCCPKLVCETVEKTTCRRNGVNHEVGVPFKIGCSYKCHCDDPKTNRIKCKHLCLNFSSLTQHGCELLAPAPGKCCKTFKCPAHIKVGLPPGYVEE